MRHLLRMASGASLPASCMLSCVMRELHTTHFHSVLAVWQVFALPRLALVFSVDLHITPSGAPAAGPDPSEDALPAGSDRSRAFCFSGLASDPSGAALVVCGTGSTWEVRVLEWPLAIPGFPDLE